MLGVHHMKLKRVRVKRHTLVFRALHWLIVAEGVTLGLTGLQLGGIWGVRVLPGGTARAVHVIVGLAWFFTALLFTQYFLAEDYKWYSISRIPYSITYMIAEAKAWFGIGPHLEEPIRYDPKKRKYIEKIVPTEAMVWWIFLILGLIIAFTGLALAFPKSFTLVYEIAGGLAAVLGGGPYSMVRAIHRVAAAAILGVVILHAYAAVVFKMLRAITLGYRDEPVAE